MRYRNILFVQARYDAEFSNVLPAGIGYLSEFLLRRNVPCTVYDLNMPDATPERLFEKIRGSRPDAVGVSMMTLNYRHTYAVIDELKKRFPDLTIIAGGPHVSTVREKALEECGGIDYGVFLEGEFTLFELMDGKLPVERIPGLLYRGTNGTVVSSGERDFIKDLDSIPFPRYSIFDKRKYSTLLSVISSRGCPYECIYCPVKLAIGRRFVTRSPANVVDELQYHYDRGYREFSFRDDNFTLIPERVFGICDEIERKGLKDIYLMCDNGIRADTLSFELLRRMREVGFQMIGLGAESGSDTVLAALKKRQRLADLERVLAWAAELRYKVELFFLIGSPGETWADFITSVELAERYPVMKASFYQLLPYPNTELFEMVRSSGRFARPPEEYLNDGSQRRNTPFFETAEMSFDERVRAFDYAKRRLEPHLRRVNRQFYLENAKKRFRSVGFSDALAAAFARVYCNNFVHDAVFNNPVSRSIKSGIKKQFLSMRMGRYSDGG